MVTLEFEIRRCSKNFHVSINIDEEIHHVEVEIDLAEYLSAILEQKEEEMIKLLALIEFIRLDSSAIKKKKFKKFIDEIEFRENLKVLLETKSVTEIIDDIGEMKYHEMRIYFFGDDTEEFEEYFEED